MSLFDDAVTLYMLNQQGKPPTATNIPLSPEQQWMFDFVKNYVSGAPAVRDAAVNYGNQFLSGLSGMQPKNFKFMSPAMQGQTFAGGAQMPQIDPSKMGMGIGANSASGTSYGAPTGTAGATASSPFGTSTGAPSDSGIPNTTPGQNSTSIGDIQQWVSAHPTTVAVIQGLVKGGMGYFDAARAVYNHFTSGPDKLPAPNDPSGINKDPTALTPAGSPTNFGSIDPGARQDWGPNQGPGYASFWGGMDSNLRYGDPGSSGGFGGKFAP